MKIRTRFVLPASLTLIVIVALGVLLPGGAAHAQLSCETPPEEMTSSLLNRLQDWFTAPDGTQFWTTDFCQFEPGIWDQIAHGGPPPDGIRPIDDPGFESVEAASEWLQPQSPVIALQVGDEARAYPLAVLTRHEIVNDEIDGIPVAVTFCPLCNSAIVFDRRVDGETLRFGVSGFLRNSDLIMWDDLTQSWWQQFTGQGIVGTYTGTQLTAMPSQVVGFGAFAEQYPDGSVISLEGLRFAPDTYGTNPYVGYDSGDPYGGFFPREQLDTRLPSTSRVLAGLVNGQPIAYPFETLAEMRVINDTVGERAVVGFWQPGATSALDRSDINSSRDVGMAALFNRELDGEVLTFSVDDEGVIRDDQTGSVWNIFGEAIEGELAGESLRQEMAAPHFWFAWAAFQPETLIYGME
ncbi:MAG: DUF3179 domain-containing protein [Anaerolineae bacterium]